MGKLLFFLGKLILVGFHTEKENNGLVVYQQL